MHTVDKYKAIFITQLNLMGHNYSPNPPYKKKQFTGHPLFSRFWDLPLILLHPPPPPPKKKMEKKKKRKNVSQSKD